MGWTRGISENAVGSLVASAVITTGATGLTAVLGMPLRDSLTVGLGVLAVALLAIMLIAIRLERAAKQGSEGTRPTVPSSNKPASSIGFEDLGRTRDGVALMRSGDRLFEFDGLAYQHYQGRDRNDQEAIRRALVAGERSQVTQWDLTQILSNQGEAIQDESVYRMVQMRANRSTRFFTRTQISRTLPDDQAALRPSRDLWRWYKGGGWESDAERFLTEGVELVAPQSAGGQNLTDVVSLSETAGILSQALYRQRQLPEWANRVRSFMVKYQ